MTAFKPKNFRDAYDFAYSQYSRSTREQLLEFMAPSLPAGAIKSYDNTPQIELAEIFSFMLADHIVKLHKISDDAGKTALHQAIQANHLRRRKSGLGKEAITVKSNEGHIGHIIGDTVFMSKKWKTFHDLLLDYVAMVLGRDWLATEIQKTSAERHQIASLCEKVHVFQQQQVLKNGMYQAVATASVSAYLRIAYDLYVLQHNVGLQKNMIDRLKIKNLFQGARYELYAASCLVRAGFEVEYEDETDIKKTHCEYVATHGETGKKFSVEAKSKHRHGIWGYTDQNQKNPMNLNINRLMKDAIEKNSDYAKVIFIDVNLPKAEGSVFEKPWAKEVMDYINTIERRPYAENKPAYLFITNSPHGHCADDEVEPGTDVMMTAVSINDFIVGDQAEVRKNHREICRLHEFMIYHSEIPSKLLDEMDKDKIA